MADYFRRSGVLLALVASASLAHASDLGSVYEQALKTDPTFKQANAQWLVDQQAYPLALTGDGVAGTGLFPNIDFTSQFDRARTSTSNTTDASATGYEWDTNYALTITQPVFNISTWLSIKEARYSVRAATATYLSAGQSLISRTAVAYLEVLRDYDILQYDLAAEAALLHELGVAKNKYSVGLDAATDVYQAQASYDLARATVIKQRVALADAKEDLRAITGEEYPVMAGLPQQIPLVAPAPHDINAWVDTALKQNYTLNADRMTMEADRVAINTTRMSRLPTVNLLGSYTYDHSTIASIGRSTEGYVGVSLDLPLFKGGYTFASTKQARYTYLKASDTVELERRTIAKSTRQDYLGVMSGISQIKADWASVNSSAKELKVTQQSYMVGSSTMEDLLSAVSTLFSSIQTWSSDRYDYLESLIQLKYDAGTLSPKDIQYLNSWMTRRVVLNKRDFSELLHYIKLPRTYLDEFLGPHQSGKRVVPKAIVRPAPHPVTRHVVVQPKPKPVTNRPVAPPPPVDQPAAMPEPSFGDDQPVEAIVVLPQPVR